MSNGRGVLRFPNSTHTYHRTKFVCWVLESYRPFSITSDRHFLVLMKTGHPHQYIPSPSTISCDLKVLFAATCKHLARRLQVSVPAVLMELKIITKLIINRHILDGLASLLMPLMSWALRMMKQLRRDMLLSQMM